MLTPEQAQILITELSQPSYDGLTQGQAYALLHEPREVPTGQYAPLVVDERGIYKLLGPELGESILIALAGAAEANPILARSVTWLRPSQGGIGLQDLPTRLMIEQLRQEGVFTEPQAAALLALAPELTEWQPARITAAFVGVSGMPNEIDAGDFSTAWEAARG